MSSLKLSSKSQVTLKKDVLRHLGVRPGQKIDLILKPNGEVTLKAKPGERSIKDIFGFLKRDGDPVLSLDEIKTITEESWAGKR